MTFRGHAVFWFIGLMTLSRVMKLTKSYSMSMAC